MDIDALFRHNAFTSLEPKQLQLLRQFASDVQGRGTTEIARLYRQLNQRMAQIKPITSAQRSAIVDAIRGFLPEKDRQKLNGIIKMFL